MTTALVVLSILVLSWCAVILLVRRAIRAAGRAGSRLAAGARTAALTRGTGPAAEAARLRRDLAHALRGAGRALQAASSVGAPTGDCRSLLARLELAARSVDAELKVVEAHPDASRRGVALAGPRERVAAITSAAGELVDGLLLAAGHDQDDLALLHTACVIEAEALRSTNRRVRA